MNASRSHFMSLIWASIAIVFFTVAAAIVIVAWSPLLPEANATDMNRYASKTTNDFSPYIALHQTESWHYAAVLREPAAITYCPL